LSALASVPAPKRLHFLSTEIAKEVEERRNVTSLPERSSDKSETKPEEDAPKETTDKNGSD